jgi:FlaA1/EpsC-like NDP-sugar epimerase
VFVLDMGEPVRIMELAESMIRLSGREPGRDVRIDVIGARPGEKLHEELWSSGEQVAPTAHPAILTVTRPEIDAAWLDAELAELGRLVEAGSTLDLVGRLAAIVREPKRNEAAAPVAGTAEAASATETV